MSDKKINIIGKRLRDLRLKKEMTLEEVGKMFGKSRASMGHYESGVREPGIEEIVKFAEFYHVTADYLLGLSDSKECAVYTENLNGHELRITYKPGEMNHEFSHDDAMKIVEKLKSIGVNVDDLLR